MSAFKVGDVCVVVKTLLNHELRGAECVIVAVGGLMYETRCSGENHTRFAFPFQLRLKRPPTYPDQHTAGDWDLCPWRPALPVKERA